MSEESLTLAQQKVLADIKANGGTCTCESTWCKVCGKNMMRTH